MPGKDPFVSKLRLHSFKEKIHIFGQWTIMNIKRYFRVELIISSFDIMLASKILVTTGINLGGAQTTSEILDLTVKGGNLCKNWPDFPITASGAAGGLIGNNVIICESGECYSMTSQKATLVTHMSAVRSHAASIVLNGNALWITGGSESYDILESTEYVKMSGTMPGPDLPMGLSLHALVAINNTVSMHIGGYADGWPPYTSASTFYHDHIGGQWINGPSLMQARSSHAAVVVTDEVTNENFVVVTGGEGGLDSTEILQDLNWVEGKINVIFSVMLNLNVPIYKND